MEEKHVSVYTVCVCPHFPLSQLGAYIYLHSHRPTMYPTEFQVLYVCHLIICTINLQDRNDYPHFTDEEHRSTGRLTAKHKMHLFEPSSPPAPQYREDKNPIISIFAFPKPNTGREGNTQGLFAGSVSL